jgi:hypothetical protein
MEETPRRRIIVTSPYPFIFIKIIAVPFAQEAILHGKSSASISALAAGENNPVFVCRGLFEPRPALSLPTQNF